MIKINDTVKQETLYITYMILIFSILMQAVFLITKYWDFSVLLGNLLSGFFSALNFLLMGISVQRAVEKEEKEAKGVMQLSHSLRTIMLFVVAVIGVLAPCFNTVAFIIPLFFPRIAIALRPLFKK